jgi:hypothetical protein
MTFESEKANLHTETKRTRRNLYQATAEYQSVQTLPQLNRDFSDSVERRRKSGKVQMTKREM